MKSVYSLAFFFVGLLLLLPLTTAAPPVVADLSLREASTLIMGLIDNRTSRGAGLLVSGTDYEPGDNAKVFTTFTIDGLPQDNATCFVKSYYPNNTLFLPFTQMLFLEKGIYYHDFTAPSSIGVYPVLVICSYPLLSYQYNMTTGTRLLGGGGGGVSNTNLIDGSYFDMNEDNGDLRFIKAHFNISNQIVLGTNNQVDSLTILFRGRRVAQLLDPVSDPIRFWLYNYNLSRYDLVGTDFSYLATDTSSSYTITTNASYYVNSSGSASILINDTAGGLSDLVQTDMRIDFLNLVANIISVNATVTSIAGGAELNIRNRTGTNNLLLQTIYDTLLINENKSLARDTQINNTVNSISNNTIAVLSGVTTLGNSVHSLGVVLNQTKSGVDNLTSSVGLLNSTVNTIFVVVNNHTLTLGLILNNTNTIISVVNNIQSDVNSIDSDVNDIQGTVNDIEDRLDNLSMSINLSQVLSNQGAILGNISLLNTTLTTIESQIFGIDNALGIISSNVTTIHNNLLAHMANESLSQSEIDALFGNLTLIQSQITSLSINISSQNLTGLNDSITGLAILVTQPPSFDIHTVLALIFVIVFIVCLSTKGTMPFFVLSLYSVFWGLLLIKDRGFVIGIVVVFLGIIFFIIGKRRE